MLSTLRIQTGLEKIAVRATQPDSQAMAYAKKGLNENPSKLSYEKLKILSRLLNPTEMNEIKKLSQALNKEQQAGNTYRPITQKILNTPPNLASFLMAFPIIGALMLLLVGCSNKKKSNKVDMKELEFWLSNLCGLGYEKYIKPEGPKVQAEYQKMIADVGTGAWNALSTDEKAQAITAYVYKKYPYKDEPLQIWQDADQILNQSSSIMDCDKYAVLLATLFYIMLQKTGLSKAEIDKRVYVATLNNATLFQPGHAVAVYRTATDQRFVMEGKQGYSLEFSNYLQDQGYTERYSFNRAGAVCWPTAASIIPLPIYNQSGSFPGYRLASTHTQRLETSFLTPTLHPEKIYTLNHYLTDDFEIKILSSDRKTVITPSINRLNQYQFQIQKSGEYLIMAKQKNIKQTVRTYVYLFENNSTSGSTPVNPTPPAPGIVNEYTIPVADTFTAGTLSTANPENNYSCDLIAGKTYEIFWNDSDAPLTGQTQDIKVGVFKNGSAVVSHQDIGYSTPITFTPTVSGTYKLNVLPYSSGNLSSNPKTYQLKIREKQITPPTGEFFNLALSTDWTQGNLMMANSSQFYKIYLEANTNYELEWDDAYQGSGTQTLDIKVNFKNLDGSSPITSIGSISNKDTTYTNPIYPQNGPLKFSVSTSGEYLIEVESYFPGNVGRYRLRMYPGVNP